MKVVTAKIKNKNIKTAEPDHFPHDSRNPEAYKLTSGDRSST